MADVEAELRRPPRRGPADNAGQVVRKKLKANHEKGGEIEYVLWVSKDYVPEKGWRLIISLHGQNGIGPDFIRNWLSDVQKAADVFLLCPIAGRGAWGHSLLGYHNVLDSMPDLLETYSVDSDLVFTDKACMGGNGSFQLDCTYPDLFAGAEPRSGVPRSLPSGGQEGEGGGHRAPREPPGHSDLLDA